MAEVKSKGRRMGMKDDDLDIFKEDLRFAGQLSMYRNRRVKRDGKKAADKWFMDVQKNRGYTPESYSDYAKRARSISGSALRGLLPGWSDEYQAGMDKLYNLVGAGKNYDAETYDLLRRVGEETNPKTAGLAEGVGGAATAVATVGGMTVPLAAKGALTGVLKPTIAGMGSGGIYGSGHEFARGSGDAKGDLGARLQGGLDAVPKGLATGIGFGALGPIGLGLGRSYRKRVASNKQGRVDKVVGDAAFDIQRDAPPMMRPTSKSLPVEQLPSHPAEGLMGALASSGMKQGVPMQRIAKRLDDIDYEKSQGLKGVWDTFRADAGTIPPSSSMRQFFRSGRKNIRKATKKMGSSESSSEEILEVLNSYTAKGGKGKPISARSMERLRTVLGEMKGKKNSSAREMAGTIIQATPKKFKVHWEESLGQDKAIRGQYNSKIDALRGSYEALGAGGKSAGERAAGRAIGIQGPITNAMWIKNFKERLNVQSLYSHKAPTGKIREDIADSAIDRLTQPAFDLNPLVEQARSRAQWGAAAGGLPQIMQQEKPQQEAQDLLGNEGLLGGLKGLLGL